MPSLPGYLEPRALLTGQKAASKAERLEERKAEKLAVEPLSPCSWANELGLSS